jgi:hypothetical protein
MAAPLDRRLPSYSGKNFAPTKPFIKLEERQGDKSPYASHPITEQIKKKYEERIKENESSWREMILNGQLIALFIQGKQLLSYNPYTHSYVVTKGSKTDPSKIKAMNLMQYFATNWEAKWISSNPDIVVTPLSNADQDIARARKANALVTHLETDMYDVWYNRHEGLMAQVFGWYGMRVRPCREKGRVVMRPAMADVEVEIGKGFWKCHDCNESGSGKTTSTQISQTDSMPTCPNCGSTAVYIDPPITQIMQQPAGVEPYRLPKIISEQLPLPACRWDLSYRMEDSSWMIYEQEMQESAIRRALGNIRLPQGESANTLGLDVIRELSTMGAPMGGASSTPVDGAEGKSFRATVSEMYLGLDDLWDIEIKGDEENFARTALPPGRMSDFVASQGLEGACFVGINGFSLLSGIYLEHHSDTHTSGVYHMKPMSGAGRGVGDAVEMQKRFNRFDSKAVRHMDAQATPATLHLAGAIPDSHKHLLGTPGVDIPVDIANFPEVKDIRQVVAPLQGTPVGGDMLQYTYQHLRGFMEVAYHITNMSSGVSPRLDNKTATGAEILSADAEEVFQPIMETKADTRLKNVKKAFNLWVRNNPVVQPIPLKEKTRTGLYVLEIGGKDVDGEYEWSVVPGSELPKNRLSKRRDRVQFYAQFGGIPGYLQMKATGQFDREIADAERAFDMDFASSDFDELGELCRLRLEMARELMGQAGGLREQITAQFGVALPEPDPMMVLPEVQPTMLVTEPDHEKKMEWFARLLDSNEGQQMTAADRNLVSAFISGHMMLAQGQQIGIQTAMAETQVAAQAPLADDQMQREQLTGEQQFQREQQGAEAEAQRSAATAPDEEAAAERELVAGEIDHQRAIEQEDLKHRHALELEKTRAKARLKATA